MGVLKVRTGDTWEDVSGVTTNEVYVGSDDPRAGIYRNAVMWYDTTEEALKVWQTALNPAMWVEVYVEEPVVGSTINVVWMNGFSGSMDFRVSPSMVTMRMGGVSRTAGIDPGVDVQVCALPAGVPAPWASIATTISANATGATAITPIEVEVRSTGVWLKNVGGGYSWDPLKASVTWSR